MMRLASAPTHMANGQACRATFARCWLAWALACTACDHTAAPPPEPSPNDPCAERARCSPATPAGGARADDEDAPGAPCERADPARAYALCVWVDEGELARISGNADARIEVPAIVSLAGERYEHVEFELHGGTARTFPKKSYRLRFATARPIFDFFGDGAEETERLVLQASWVDPTYVRAKLVFDTLRELGALAPRVAHARLYINGELKGLYQVIERIDEHFLEAHGLSRDGNLYKAESNRADFARRANPLEGFSERTNEDGEAADLGELFEAVHETPASHADFEAEIATRLHLGDFALWNQVMVHALNVDTFSKNYYLFHDPDATDGPGSIFRIIHWDADATFGQSWTGERLARPDEATLFGPRNALAPRLYGIPTYRAAYVAQLRQLLAGPLAAERLARVAATLLDELAPDIRDDLARWERETTYEDERAYLEDVIHLREEAMEALLASEPEAVGAR